MKKIIILSLLTGLFAGELEVEGNLTVTEGVNASSFAGDGSGLTNLPSLGDMKPDRIYRYQRLQNSSFNFTVPQNKIWLITAVGASSVINFNGITIPLSHSYSGQKYIFGFAGDVLSSHPDDDSPFFLSIQEYPISGSGTDQGMDYVEP